MEEKRFFNIRATGGKEMYLDGYALVFESPATHNGITEIIDRHALDGTWMIDVPLRYNHSENQLKLATTRNNSLMLTVDDIGLRVVAKLIDTKQNVDIYKSIQAGLLDKMSFAFTADKEDFDYQTKTRRILHINQLYDVSVVVTPFYESTSIVARWADDTEDIATVFRKMKQKKIAHDLEARLRGEAALRKLKEKYRNK